MIILEKLIIDNFESYKHEEIDLRSKGVVLITGKNGSGKSSIVIDAFQYILYGKTERYSSYKFLMRKGQKTGFVILTGYKDDSYFELTRKFSDRGQEFKFCVNGEELTTPHIVATQELLDSFLKTPWQVFTNIITIQGEPILFSEPDSFQKTFLERMLGLEIFNDCYRLAKDVESSLLEKQVEYSMSYEKLLQNDMYLKKRLEDLSNSQKLVNDAVVNELQQHINTLNQAIVNFNSTIEKNNEQILKKQDEVKSFMNKVASINSQVTEIHKKRRYPTTYVLQEKINGIMSDFEDGKCPTCNQPWEGRKNMVDELKSQIAESTNIENEILKLNEEAAGYLKIVEKFNHDISRLDNEKKIYESQKIQCIDKIKKYEKDIEETKKTVFVDIKEVENDLDKNKKLMEETKSSIERNKNEKAYIEDSLEAFGNKGIVSLKIRQNLLACGEDTNKIFEHLTNNELSCQFLPMRKLQNREYKNEIDLKVTNNFTGQILDYDNLSVGQKAVLSLAALLSFHKMIRKSIGVSWNILILDEVLEKLDDEALRRSANLLSSLNNDFGTILLTSHRQETSDLFNNQLEITSLNGISSINYSI